MIPAGNGRFLWNGRNNYMPVDINRRKAVMARSIKLGHCVCNPKLPCPCPNFKEHNICSCAGERLPVKTGDVSLTQHVRKAGCASKIGQADLAKILSKLPPVTDPRVLVGAAAGDDAGIYKLDDRYSLVQTVDVFTPCVDDPYLFGVSKVGLLGDKVQRQEHAREDGDCRKGAPPAAG